MILSCLHDPFLRAALRRAALPEEDVLQDPDEVWEGLQLGFPRLLVYAAREGDPFVAVAERLAPRLPHLVITEPTLRSWESARRAREIVVGRIEDSAGRLRPLIRGAADRRTPSERLLREMSAACGQRLPPSFRGVARRVLELPGRYSDTSDLAEVADLSGGALKERFRRRGMASPSVHLRWLRVLAVGEILSDPDVTVSEAAHRVGMMSGGSLCRFVQSTVDVRPTDLRSSSGRRGVLVRFVTAHLDRASLAGWEDLDGLFLRGAA